MFLTRLAVSHVGGKRWELTDPLVWAGKDELLVIRSRFATDFASIPKPLRWLLDNAGENSEAAVLHDAVWRESRQQNPRVDPADADGIFRRALRETGSTALTRGLMWFGVRATAIGGGRYGKKGPTKLVKIAQLLGMFALGACTALLPTIVAFAGLGVFWVANWIVALAWRPFERSRFPEFAANWPWLPFRHAPKIKALDQDLLVLLPLGSDVAGELIAAIHDRQLTTTELEAIVGPPE
jgi:hypothetical protein